MGASLGTFSASCQAGMTPTSLLGACLLAFLQEASALSSMPLLVRPTRSMASVRRATPATALSPALLELQCALLPAAIGTVQIVWSNFENMFSMNKVRYDTDKTAEIHPYKPWADEREDAEAHLRAFKACQNGAEWSGYALPILWLYVLYTPAVPFVGKLAPWAGAVLATAFARFNVRYVKAYIASAEARVAPFTRRTWAFNCLFMGFVVGAVSSVVRAARAGMLIA